MTSSERRLHDSQRRKGYQWFMSLDGSSRELLTDAIIVDGSVDWLDFFDRRPSQYFRFGVFEAAEACNRGEI